MERHPPHRQDQSDRDAAQRITDLQRALDARCQGRLSARACHRRDLQDYMVEEQGFDAELLGTVAITIAAREEFRSRPRTGVGNACNAQHRCLHAPLAKSRLVLPLARASRGGRMRRRRAFRIAGSTRCISPWANCSASALTVCARQPSAVTTPFSATPVSHRSLCRALRGACWIWMQPKSKRCFRPSSVTEEQQHPKA